MKTLVLSLVCFLFTVSASAADLYKKNYKMSGEGDAEQRIIETFKAALSDSKSNPVKTAIEQLKKDVDDMGTVSSVSEANLFEIYSGKGSATSYGRRFLVGVPVSMQGTGLIEKYDLFYTVYYAMDMALEKESVTIEAQVAVPND